MKTKETVLELLDKQSNMIQSTKKGLEISAFTPQQIVQRLVEIAKYNTTMSNYVRTER